ncbi:transposase [Bradyrhizobium sp. NC92]|nr:transposase [Bradyrhizobium sp. NC92]UWU67992.1 transposase [Bradyrhizobium sp. NC92]
MTPRPHSSGGKERLGGISKMANAELRSLLVVRRRPSCGLSEPTLGRGRG